MTNKLKVIEYAEKRLKDKQNADYECAYWAAYLDGTKAVEKEMKDIVQINYCPLCGKKFNRI